MPSIKLGLLSSRLAHDGERAIFQSRAAGKLSPVNTNVMRKEERDRADVFDLCVSWYCVPAYVVSQGYLGINKLSAYMCTLAARRTQL